MQKILETDEERKKLIAALRLTQANIEMARAKSYAKGFQDGLKAARRATADKLNQPPTLTQPGRD